MTETATERAERERAEREQRRGLCRPIPDWVPPHVAALVKLLELGDEFVGWNAEAFDGDEHVSGADAVEFMCEHRDKVRDVIAEYRRTTKENARG